MMSRNQQGFTLVELTISMTFIAALLLAVAMLTIQISTIYNKGFTLREVNEAGQFMSSELQRTLNQTSNEVVVYYEFEDKQGARLCAGTTVYAWNYRETLKQGQAAINQRRESADISRRTNDVRFMKFSGGDEYCEMTAESDWLPIPDSAIELLSAGNSNIALDSLDWSDPATPAGDNSQAIYTIDMVVGTTDTGRIQAGNCRGDNRIDDAYCAVNRFSFTARSGNKEIQAR